MAQANDATLTGWALATKTGDRAAATAFIRATQQQVFRFLTYLVDARYAGDLTYETYLRAMRRLPRLAAGSLARTWLYAIAGQVTADHIRAAAGPGPVDRNEWHSAVDTVRWRWWPRKWWDCRTNRRRRCATTRSAPSGPG